jgi:transcription-repair coupling factor (superfamily II helicase)
MSERVWEEISRTLRSGAPYRALLGGRAELVRLPVPAAAWVGCLLAQDLKRPLVAVVPREADALTWMEATRLFGDRPAVYFPGPSLTPYQEAEVSLQVRAQEAVALDGVLSGAASIVVTTPRALFRRLPRPDAFGAAALTLRPGDDQPLDRLTAHLARYGYRRTDLVYEVGDYAVRGGILDLYPPGEEAPIRVDLFGDTVESIRWFDAQSQRSEDTLDAIRVLPLYLFPGGASEARRLADLLTAQQGDLGPAGAELIESLRTTGGFTGWENYLPLLFDSISLLDALPQPLLFAVDPPALQAETEHHAERLDADFATHYESGRLAAPPAALELPATAVLPVLAAAPYVLSDLVGGAAALAPLSSPATAAAAAAPPAAPRAGELLNLYAERKRRAGPRVPARHRLAARVRGALPLHRDARPARRDRAVKADMEAPRPMDRLICGDVGYGKTEVALRAAFKAAAGRQAGDGAGADDDPRPAALRHLLASASPTTRSRSSTSRASARRRAEGGDRRFAEGEVDILIGTHRLLSRDVRAKDLGLLIVDEEQRFGVKQKELLRQLKLRST